mgnify:CR=1 FL=1
MAKNKKTHGLSKLLTYVLERKPDEFGLVPDADGFIPVADLLKVAKEEGWHRVRRHDGLRDLGIITRCWLFSHSRFGRCYKC